MLDDFGGVGRLNAVRSRHNPPRERFLGCAGVVLLAWCSACSSDSRGHGRLINADGLNNSSADADDQLSEPTADSGAVVDGSDSGASENTEPHAPVPDSGTEGTDPSNACLNATTAPEAPLRRLRHFEYNSTLRELGDATEPANSFLPEVDGQNDVSQGQVEDYLRAARDFARRVTSNENTLVQLTGCNAEVDGEAACRQTFVRDFIGRAFRRPATADDVVDFEAVFTQGSDRGGGFIGGVQAVVEVALQSPEFLYHVELGEPLDDDDAPARPAGWARPTPHEMANRLSYFLWGAPPDNALLASAAQGDLRHRDAIAHEARRMLEDDRARATVRRFYFDLFGIPSASSFINLQPDIAELALSETERFIDAVTWEERGEFADLLTAPFTFLNERLAAHYGIADVNGEDMVRVELGTNYGAGILTHASFLSSLSPSDRTSPTRRGLHINQVLLCRGVLPPPDVTDVVPPPSSGRTTRERLVEFTRAPTCAACHDKIDPLGFAFEHYDGAGRFRETEDGYAIDATGFVEVDGRTAHFDGPRELAATLAASNEAQQCFTRNWMTFARARPLTDSDACSLEQLDASFAEANGNVRELLVALTQTDAFLYRPALPEQP